jgi:hypothetical protein
LSRGGSKRRLRVRRKRRDGSIVGDLADEAGGEVVAEFGCCLVEAVGGLSVLVALMFVPYVLLS